jgi:hypothetical protein
MTLLNKEWVFIALAIALYSLIQAVILVKAPVERHIANDAGGYYQLALGIKLHGKLVEPEAPEQIQLERQPLYPLFLSGILAFSENIKSLVAVQVFLHIGIAFIALLLANQLIPKYRALAFALVLLNPNAIGTSQLLLTETLYTLLINLALLAIVNWTRNYKAIYAFGGILCCALAALTRPEAQYLVYLTPLFFLLFPFFFSKERDLKAIAISVLMLVPAYSLTLLPWANYIQQHTQNLQLSSGEKRYDHLSYNTAILERRHIGSDDIKATYYELEAQAEAYTREHPEKSQLDFYKTKLASYSVNTYISSLSWSWAQLFISGGGQNIVQLLELDTQKSPINLTYTTTPLRHLQNRLASSEALLASAISTGSIIFSFLARLLGLFGVYYLLRNKEWNFIIPALAYIGFITLLVLLNGSSRFRIAMEPSLMLLVIYGLAQWESWRKKEQK